MATLTPPVHVAGTYIWWAPSETPDGHRNGTAHAIRDGGALCHANPSSMGASTLDPSKVGCRPCKRCLTILKQQGAHSD